MKYGSYKHYILANRIKDSKDAFRAYLEIASPIYKAMNDKMKAQHVEKTYIYRFTIQF